MAEGPGGQKPSLILVVDDSRSIRMMVCGMLEDLGYDFIEADNGQAALDALDARADEVDAILLDREMPVMDGMAATAKIKENRKTRRIPIVMQTSADGSEQISQGIEAGVFYYLTKPINPNVLKSVLAAAVRERHQQRSLFSDLQKQQSCFNLIDACTFRIRSLDESENLAVFLANCFPEPERSVSGLAELLINAIEHGNLGITYAEKGDLVARGTWREEVVRRSELAENAKKYALVRFERSNDNFRVQIKDQGSGFDWKDYLQIEPARAMDNHGRGIAQANSISFDELIYNPVGNEVTAVVKVRKALDW